MCVAAPPIAHPVQSSLILACWIVPPSSSPDLLGQFAPALPWLPDETLFSLCSRHHRLWGHRLSSRSTQLMFGGHRSGTLHDIPGALNEFADRTHGRFGEPADIARDRTLLHFYRPFTQAAQIAQAVRVMGGSSVTGLKFQMGILTSRFRANHPLKACPSCMHSDMAEHGWSHWRLVHQFPGVWTCPTHGSPLSVCRFKSNGVERFLWRLPEVEDLDVGWTESAGVTQSMVKLSQLAADLTMCPVPDGALRPESVQGPLQVRMRENGWITANGRLRLEASSASFLAHCSRLRGVPELRSLPSTVEEAKGQLGRFIRPLRSGTHPLRTLVMVSWLFDDAADFLRLHGANAVLEAPRAADESSTDDSSSSARVDELVTLLRAGHSARAAASALGIDVATAMTWAARADIAVDRRPKVLKGPLRTSLLQSLADGADKAIVAERHGVSVVTVTRILHSEVGLHAKWKARRQEVAREAARDAWQGLVAGHPTVGVKLLRAMNPAAYAWLYRNDREWLSERSPKPEGGTSMHRGSSVRWDERDLVLSAAVAQAALKLAATPGRRPLKLWQLYQEVPELKPKLAVLHRLPLTQRAIGKAIGRHRSRSDMEDLFD